MVSWWWRCWVGEQRSRKRTLGTSFRLQTLSICVTNNFYHCASKSCFVYARRVTWEKKSFRIFWKCQISNRGKVLVWFVLRKAPVKVDTTILRNKAVTLLPIFSLNNKVNFFLTIKREQGGFLVGLFKRPQIRGIINYYSCNNLSCHRSNCAVCTFAFFVFYGFKCDTYCALISFPKGKPRY